MIGPDGSKGLSGDGVHPGLGPGVDFGFSGAGNSSLLRGTGSPQNRSIGDVVSTVGRVVVLCANRRTWKTSLDILDGSWQPEPTDPTITCQVVTIGLCETSDGGGVVSPSGRYKRLRSDTNPDMCSTLTM